MHKVSFFKNAGEAISALDNGGRFYHLLTKANDGIVSAAELGKVAGVYSNKQQMIIYLCMSVALLDPQSVEEIKATLSPDLQSAYDEYLPQLFSPSQAESQSIVAQSAIITGVPRHIESKADFNGFIMVPIFAGSVVTFVLIPIIDKYDVYQLRDEESAAVFFIAHARGAEKLPKQKLKVGGIIKELKTSKDEKGDTKKFLEALYYAETE